MLINVTDRTHRYCSGHNKAVAESFFQLLNSDRIMKKIYGTREQARSDIFITSQYFITADIGMIQVIRFHRLTGSAQRDYFTLSQRMPFMAKQLQGLQLCVRSQCIKV